MKQIIAMGGGGFSMEPDNPLLDRYVLEAAGKPDPVVCFLPTASGDSADYIVRFYDGEAERRPSFHSLLKSEELPPGYALDDGAAVHFVDKTASEVVSSQESAHGFEVRCEEGRVIEERLPVRFLGAG